MSLEGTPLTPENIATYSFFRLPRRLWIRLTEAIYRKDMDAATDAKSEVENAQREAARKREEGGVKHAPRFFEQNKSGQWVPKIL